MLSTVVSLTGSAQRHADKRQIRDEVSALGLGWDCLQGDIVSVEIGGRPHEFIIVRRRWVIGSAGRRLEITLDHPARAGAP